MNKLFKITFVLLLVLILQSSLFAKVTHIEISSRSPFLKGQSFGDIGTYEAITGIVYFEVDPAAPANQMVIDLDKAKKQENGGVLFSADFLLLVPSQKDKINQTLIYEFNNRGYMWSASPYGEYDALFERGFTFLSCGWIGELLPSDTKLRLHAPIAYEGDKELIGLVRMELIGQKGKTKLSINREGHGAYEPTGKGYKTATLTKRLKESHPRIVVEPDTYFLESSWDAYECARNGLPEVSLCYPDTFQQGYIYELIYEAKNSIVQGLGFAAIRDLVSFLRYETSKDHPLLNEQQAPLIKHTISYGVSQSGRAIRMFVYDGFNADEAGRIVFDGGLPQVAGAGMGFFNHRFASPTRFSTQRESYLFPSDIFPFTYGESIDPFTGKRDGLLKKAIAQNVVPKIIHLQSSAEYWHRSAALSTIEPSGEKDALIPDNVRIYSVTGQHGPGKGIPDEKKYGTIATNHTYYTPLVRGLLVALDNWIKTDAIPPASVYPKLANGTLGPWQEGLCGWKAIKEVNYPKVIQQAYVADYGPDFSTKRIISQHPPIIQQKYPILVAQVDADNNEKGMLQLPAVALPTGTYTGWNLRTAAIKAEGELLRLTGGYIPFAKSKKERLANKDPRLSIEERYASYEAYKKAYIEKLQKLIAQGYLLPDDFSKLVALMEKNSGLIE